MNQSESLSNLAAVLAEVQGQLRPGEIYYDVRLDSWRRMPGIRMIDGKQYEFEVVKGDESDKIKLKIGNEYDNEKGKQCQ